ncbi:MAG: type I-F CRISPR-associated protein Csy2 [Verrucomicrobiales bacterium]|nr:type I-F CRISPR-associated protein Csy2 [Verrucomicrobiales bacterium]
MIQNILTIPRIVISDANAFSSPFTVGFPAMTAWLGAVHALQRKFTDTKFSKFNALRVGVVSHQFKLRAHRSGYVTSLIGERHPLKKDGNSPSFVEEPKCHLTISLVIEFSGVSAVEHDEFLDSVYAELLKMRMAGGVIQKLGKPKIAKLDKTSDNYPGEAKRLQASLMPGYALLERSDLMIEAMREGKDALEAVLDAVSVTQKCSTLPNEDKPHEKVAWDKGSRKYKGWIVPIATGFHALTEPATALNQRDPETPHRFAEAVVTLGEFKMPHRLSSVDDILWHYHFDSENNLYTCKQTN